MNVYIFSQRFHGVFFFLKFSQNTCLGSESFFIHKFYIVCPFLAKNVKVSSGYK